MREVRMTFGEHLEDLRKRILFSLLYLTVGISITMVYGKELMEWTLGPHYQAIMGAQRDRRIARMERTVKRLNELTSATPIALAEEGQRVIEGPIYWEPLFIRDVAMPRTRDRLEAPFRKVEAELRNGALPSLAPGDKDKLAAMIGSLGTELSKALAEEFPPALVLETYANIPARFVEVRRLLKKTETLVGPNELQKMIGWGKDLSHVIQPLESFVAFLDLRRAQVVKSDIPIATLVQRMKETELPRILNDLLQSLEADVKEIVEGKPKAPMVITYMESFMTYLKVALIFGILITLPFILYEVWKFVGAGLHPHEQKYVVSLLPFSLGLFLAGALFGYFALIPIGLRFLAGWGLEDVELNITLESYIGLFFTMTLILGLVFQTPLIMIFLAKIGVVTVKGLRKARRMAIFVGVCLAVVLTPPDPFSWSLMAAPMLLLYEFGILLCSVMEKGQLRAGEPDVLHT